MEQATRYKTEFWLDHANGSRFLVGEDHNGPNGEPYVVLRLAPDDPDALPFRQIALGLYDTLKGAILCHQGWSPPSDDSDFLLVYYGDVLDVLMTGRLWDRAPWTLGWGCPDDFPFGYVGAEVSDPSLLVLPLGARKLINWLLSDFKVTDSSVSLLTTPDGLRSLVFNGLDGSTLDEEDQRSLGWRISWCLPRYYAASIVESGNLCRFPLMPEEDLTLLSPLAPVSGEAPRKTTCDKPRSQHYYFAHQYLREKVEASPGFEISHLREDSADSYLKTLWGTVGLMSRSDNDKHIPADTIEILPVNFSAGWGGAIIRFPLPECQAEAYFAAAVYKGVYSDFQGLPLPHRYITLELGEWSDETVLGEWVRGMHFHLGEGPIPDERSFARAVAVILAEDTDD